MKSINNKISILVFASIIMMFLFFIGCVTTPSSKQPDEVLSTKLIEIKTRPGVTQKFILIKPENPVACVILFAGGSGHLKLTNFFGKPSVNRIKNTFVVRAREDFAKHGCMVALVDKPSDKAPGLGKTALNTVSKENELFRMSDKHAQDIEALALYLKKKSNIPVWLVGTSWGTVSATNGAARIKSVIDGLVLTSSMTRSRKNWQIYDSYPNIILNMELDKITVPTLIVSHKDDRCISTPAEDAQKIKEKLKNSQKVEAMYVSGGKRAIEKDCWGLSAHGFYGNEKEVVTAIVEFIEANSPNKQ